MNTEHELVQAVALVASELPLDETPIEKLRAKLKREPHAPELPTVSTQAPAKAKPAASWGPPSFDNTPQTSNIKPSTSNGVTPPWKL